MRSTFENVWENYKKMATEFITRLRELNDNGRWDPESIEWFERARAELDCGAKLLALSPADKALILCEQGAYSSGNTSPISIHIDIWFNSATLKKEQDE